MKLKITEKGINLLLIFILGFLVGVALKSEAQKRVTLGFNDYLVPKYKQDINLMTPQVQSQAQNQNPSNAQNPGQSGQQNPQPAPDNAQSQQ